MKVIFFVVMYSMSVMNGFSQSVELINLDQPKMVYVGVKNNFLIQNICGNTNKVIIKASSGDTEILDSLLVWKNIPCCGSVYLIINEKDSIEFNAVRKKLPEPYFFKSRRHHRGGINMKSIRKLKLDSK